MYKFVIITFKLISDIGYTNLICYSTFKLMSDQL